MSNRGSSKFQLKQTCLCMKYYVHFIWLYLPQIIQKPTDHSFLRKGKLVGIFSCGKINLSCFEKEEEAKELLDNSKTLLNKAFARYDKHGPPDPKLIEMRGKVSPLEIYNYLPKANCKECGEQGCFPFAVKLSNGEKTLQDCPQIQLPKYSSNKAHLEKTLQPIKLEG